MIPITLKHSQKIVIGLQIGFVLNLSLISSYKMLSVFLSVAVILRGRYG